MTHFDPANHHHESNLFYWLIWATTFIISKTMGLAVTIATSLNGTINIPEHQIKYLPQLSELIPALILAAGCAFVSFVVSKISKLLWNKVFPNQK